MNEFYYKPDLHVIYGTLKYLQLVPHKYFTEIRANVFNNAIIVPPFDVWLSFAQ